MDWDSLDDGKFMDESRAISKLLAAIPFSEIDRERVKAEAVQLVETTRKAARREGVAESFLREFNLATQEGLALMCLAEALLRTPDEETRSRLIAEKVSSADWASHAGKSKSLFVNASTWGLILSGRLTDIDEEAKRDLSGFLMRVANRIGEPVIRRAIASAIRIMGGQFVMGRTIDAALKRAKSEGVMCSFDMLGEGARTAADAERYFKIYSDAIETVGQRANGAGPEAGHGISVKLSALSPRYEAVQEARVWSELYPRLRALALIAARYDINFTIDAEEADRLAISLKLLERLACEPELGSWRGLGLAVQAYQKRALKTIAAVKSLAEETGRRLMVRLVKGAYWDNEIKRAQVAGRPGYPVYTTKSATDLSYLICASALIDASPHLYAQFATHNAHTLAAVRKLARSRGVAVEYQRLHGMGEALYDAAKNTYGDFPLRAYAPVGSHEELLPYLVRRLLENGANTSFVHVLLDERVPTEVAIVDPVTSVEAAPGPHPRLPLPAHIYGETRRNSAGIDLSIGRERAYIARALADLDEQELQGFPIVDGKALSGGDPVEMRNPADRSQVIGKTSSLMAAYIDDAFNAAHQSQPQWNRAGGEVRAAVLRAMGDALEENRMRLIALLVREAGKTIPDAVGEVREAVDFCRYYASLAEDQFGLAKILTGPVGETNTLALSGRGVFVCISPWNFPLAIFTGQIAAALAAGNAVIAKPAEQTPLIAAEAVRIFHDAGLDRRLLTLASGNGETVGAGLIAHPACNGVAFTGGTDTAWRINRALAARDGPIVPFIAETGGLNAMFVDTTAQREQVVDDVILSAFGSAGQRCSALRILFLPCETADLIIDAIVGAMDTLVLGDPADVSTDIGPLIDAQAKAALEAHCDRLRREAKILHQIEFRAAKSGFFFGPVLAEIPSADFLEREVFGPILHVVRYRPGELASSAKALAERGYGLTLGVHSRIEDFAEEVAARVPAGNLYVNRSMIGAVVGVQPFGGEGLSGTGPKAGGPHALLRYAVERSISINITAQGGDPKLLNL